MMSLLEVIGLSTYYDTGAGYNQALENVSFSLSENEIFGLIGESGCGKSTTGYSIMRMISHPGKIMGGEVHLDGKDIYLLKEGELRKVLWNDIAMIPQSAMNALNPCYRIGDQIMEAINTHYPDMPKVLQREKVIRLLESVGLDEKWFSAYPHTLSGGMKQRAVIAMALSCDPKVIISDESTTGLDVLVEAQVLAILRDLKDKKGIGIIIISHDLRMITAICDRIGVMYAGNLVEIGMTDEIQTNARHPYTKALFSSQIDVNDFSKRVDSIDGVVPKLINPVNQCRFFTRCKEKIDICSNEPPGLTKISDTHSVACYKEAGYV